MTSTTTSMVIAGPRNGITVEKIEAEVNKKPLEVLTSPKSYSHEEKITIEGFDFRKLDVADQKQCAVTNCKDVTIRRCIFGNKTTKGQGLNITGDGTKRVTVEYCIFENMSFSDENGGEPLRLGNSQFSGCNFESTVRNCVFRQLTSDVETISIKSCNNIIEDNFFIKNKSNVTVRHGGLAKIRHNYFKSGEITVNGKTIEANCGARIHGYGSSVEYNCFEDNKDDGKFAPITIRKGDAPHDPNFTDVKTPCGKEGTSHHSYAQAIDTVIANNEFKNCKKTILKAFGDGSLEPQNITDENNKVVTKFTFESQGGVGFALHEDPSSYTNRRAWITETLFDASAKKCRICNKVPTEGTDAEDQILAHMIKAHGAMI